MRKFDYGVKLMMQHPFWKAQSHAEEEIASEIARTKAALNQTENSYNQYTDSDLIDYCIYQKLALQAKLNYLYALLKQDSLRNTVQVKEPLLPKLLYSLLHS